MNPKIFSISVITVVTLIGCSKESSSPLVNTESTNLRVTPRDGDSGIRLDAGITLTFPKPVDRAVVERNVHLISEVSMADSLCPLSTSMAHGVMDMAMMDSWKMNHLVDRHRSSGRFQWNGDNTQCTFRPDSLLTPGTRYMVHIGREIVRMMQNHLGGGGMMGGHSIGMMNNDIMYHFRTNDTAGAGGGR